MTILLSRSTQHPVPVLMVSDCDHMRTRINLWQQADSSKTLVSWRLSPSLYRRRDIQERPTSAGTADLDRERPSVPLLLRSRVSHTYPGSSSFGDDS